MIDNASELAHGLKALETGGLLVKWTFFPDESYPSVPLATIGRAVWFALRTRPGQVPAP